MSELPSGVSYRTLLAIIELTDKGLSLSDSFDELGIYPEMGKVLSSKTAYWFLFDNLNRDSAQELWVLTWKKRRESLDNSEAAVFNRF